MSIAKLIEGFKSFHQKYYIDQPELYKNLAEKGQAPEVMVIACSDSRINPSIIMEADPGEMFVVRNVANLVPPYEPNTFRSGIGACIEFAVQDLAVRHIIVFGHSHCGGIKRLCDGSGDASTREFIDGWVSIANLALDSQLEGEEKYRQVERKAVNVSLNNLLTFPWLKEKFDKNELELHGWFFDLESGKLLSRMVNDDWTILA